MLHSEGGFRVVLLFSSSPVNDHARILSLTQPRQDLDITSKSS